MRVTVNPDTQASGDFDYVADGDYLLRVVKCEQQHKQGSEHAYLKWTFEHPDPNLLGVNGKKPGQIFENTTLKPEAQFRLRDVCEALGIKWGDFDTEDVVGEELKVRLRLDDYQGTISNKVAKFYPAK